MFEPVSSRVNFPEMEKRVIAFWKEKRIFERSVEERDASNLYVLYEGPPTANASPGVHHVLSRVFKDVMPRYKTMKGFRVPRKAGWDTHGLPVELSIEKKLGFTSKDDIEKYGVEKFNKLCRDSVFSYVKEWNEMTERIGYWVDMEHPYVTLDNSYIETGWWVIKQLWDKGLVYQGYRVTPHCPRCGTSLSSHEVALGYDEVDDPSVYIKFKVVADARNVLKGADLAQKPAYLLAWTTTPWTLPGNTALAVAPNEDYAVMEGEGDYLVMAAKLVGVVGLEGYSEVGRVAGASLEGIAYEPLFNPDMFGIERKRFDKGGSLAVQEPQDDLTYKAIGAAFVSMEDGTGIVHIAPSFGEDDFSVGTEKGLNFVRDYVGLDGVIKGSYPFAGKFVKDADPLIIKDLKIRGHLYRKGKIKHTYPFCWRCTTPLLYYAKPSWYIRTTARKERLISGNDEINWYPEHIKKGRFGDWLEHNVDWACSRERYWGTPLPVWRCESCGADECVGSIEDLKSRAGLTGIREPLDLHRPFVDEITFDCPKCRSKMRRVHDVLDAWFDSGAMPVAQWHYPFENKDTFEKFFPADYICEAVDQTRGWFYTLHALSTLLFDKPCYRNVICLGHILDAKGEKMSKSKGNVVEPAKVLDKQGADALRWYLLTSSPAGSPRRFSAELVAETQRKFLSTLWNTYSFFVLYANIDKFDPRAAGDVKIEAELERWILSDLNQLIDYVDKSLEGYDPTAAGRRIHEFVDDLSNWYVRRSRRRFWKSESDTDKMSAYVTLYQCLVTLSKLTAPFTPFVAEEIYRNLVLPVDAGAPESVHLARFPEADLSKVDEGLSQDIHLAMKICSMGRAARSRAGIKVRQPLSRVLVKTRAKSEQEGIERLKDSILDELNVKTIEFIGRRGDYCNIEVESNVNLEASEAGRLHKDGIIKLHTDFDDEDIHFKVKKGQQTLVSESTIDYVGKEGYSVAHDGGYWVAIDKAITPELADEGLVREVVHRIQTMRKDAGFEIADYITTYYEPNALLDRVLKNAELVAYIKQETLSRDVVEGIPAEAYKETHKIEGREITLGVKR
ncbi:MAG: isoleucine--tRNA ligase [Dehalococcoidia bacterium]|jgi:isoleucyl-tRNA synthetase